MKKNIGKIDRILRLTGGFVLIIISLIMGISGTLSIVFLALGILLILTGLSSFCPMYQVLKMKTNKE